MRYELTDHEWAAIKPMLSNTSHAVSHEPPCPQSMGRSRGGLTTRFRFRARLHFWFFRRNRSSQLPTPSTVLSIGFNDSKSWHTRTLWAREVIADLTCAKQKC